MITSSNMNRQAALSVFVEFLVRCLYRSWLGFPAGDISWRHWLEGGRVRLRDALSQTDTPGIRTIRLLPKFAEQLNKIFKQQLGQRFPLPPTPRRGARPSPIRSQLIDMGDSSCWSISYDVSGARKWILYNGVICMPTEGANCYIRISLRLVLDGANCRLEYTPPAKKTDAQWVWNELCALHQAKWPSLGARRKRK